MIPRKPLDIGLSDLCLGAAYCLWQEDRAAIERRTEANWHAGGASMVCLSVRSGFDALLSALNFPAGSEILVSALTIRDMPRIIQAHGLIAVPVDIDIDDLSLSLASLERAVTPRTKAILVAHLFGGRMAMAPVVAFAKNRGLVVIEDCAQAYSADAYCGHPDSDVSLFSFGSIKTATALGGAILRFRDRSLRDLVQRQQERWPVQRRSDFFARIAKYSLLVALAWRPLYTLFVSLCRAAGTSHDHVISARVRGFPGEDFFAKIRARPSVPLLKLLERRLAHYDRGEIVSRMTVANLAKQLMPQLRRPGAGAAHHSYWLYPILHDRPDELIDFLWRRGFDATQGASSMHVVRPPSDRPWLAATNAEVLFAQLLYLPVHTGMARRDIQSLADCLRKFETAGQREVRRPAPMARN